MCENHAVLAVRDLHKTWIAVTEIKSGGNSSLPTMQPNDYSETNDQMLSDEDLVRMFPFLDIPLRPVTPDSDDPKSMAVYEEHKQLAREYLKVQSELIALKQEKNRILDKQIREQQQQEEQESLAKLQNEYESLVLFKNSLVAQKEGHQCPMANNRSNGMTRDGWEIVNRTDQ